MKLLNAGGNGPSYSRLHIIDNGVNACYDEFGDSKSGPGVSVCISTCDETRTGNSVIINKAQAQALVDLLVKRFDLGKSAPKKKVLLIQK